MNHEPHLSQQEEPHSKKCDYHPPMLTLLSELEPDGKLFFSPQETGTHPLDSGLS